MTHSKEIKRWADSENNTKVWERDTTHTTWSISAPHNRFLYANYIYIIDDEYAELRKAYADGKTIEMWSTIHNIWLEVTEEIGSVQNRKYRIKPEKKTYYYQWEKLIDNEIIKRTVTDQEAETRDLLHKDWHKIESSKRTWDH